MAVILVGFPRDEISLKVRSILIHHGFTDVRLVSGGMEALREMAEVDFGLLICPVRMKDMDYIEVLKKMPSFCEILLLDSARNIAGRKEEDVMALTSPVTGHDLVETVGMMVDSLDYSYRQEKRQRRKKPRERPPEEKALIDEAKSRLMERNHLTEPEAFRYMQKSSMDCGRSLVETAKMVLTVF